MLLLAAPSGWRRRQRVDGAQRRARPAGRGGRTATLRDAATAGGLHGGSVAALRRPWLVAVARYARGDRGGGGCERATVAGRRVGAWCTWGASWVLGRKSGPDSPDLPNLSATALRPKNHSAPQMVSRTVSAGPPHAPARAYGAQPGRPLPQLARERSEQQQQATDGGGRQRWRHVSHRQLPNQQLRRPASPAPQTRPYALGATFASPLMIRSIASPPCGSVRLASNFRTNFISTGCVSPCWAAIRITRGLPMAFTKPRPSE